VRSRRSHINCITLTDSYQCSFMVRSTTLRTRGHYKTSFTRPTVMIPRPWPWQTCSPVNTNSAYDISRRHWMTSCHVTAKSRRAHFYVALGIHNTRTWPSQLKPRSYRTNWTELKWRELVNPVTVSGQMSQNRYASRHILLRTDWLQTLQRTRTLSVN